MRRNRQLVFDAVKGDCFRACLTSILGIPNNPKLPGTTGFHWLFDWSKILRDVGLELHYEQKACWRSGYWIASVPSLNIDGCVHAIVMREHLVEFDPSTRKRYKRGDNLLGKGIVRGGTYIEVIDPSKLPKFVKWVESRNRSKGSQRPNSDKE